MTATPPRTVVRPCLTCDGAGKHYDTGRTCFICDGNGTVRRMTAAVHDQCPWCKGWGHDGMDCPYVKGPRAEEPS